jgi:hypothetical protein
MKTGLILVVLSASLAAGCMMQTAVSQDRPAAVSTTHDPKPRSVVLVELFTSEGCSSCPPADRALKFLADQQPVPNAEIIPLAFHVDYWNNLGWNDKFSSPTYSRRQELYVTRFGLGSSYTPEMVVDGRAEFVGNDTSKAVKKISEAANEQKGKVALSLNGDALSVSITALPEHHPVTVFLAVAESNIISAVKGGENDGLTINHSSVVRSLSTLGLIDKDANSFETKGAIPTVAGLKRENCQLVVFVQDNTTRKILAAGTASK